MSGIQAVPMTQREALEFVANFHRHSLPPRGALFQLGASDGGRLVGVGIAGRPVARALQDSETIEALRCCVLDDAPKGTCSFLYASLWRAGRALGYRRMITYTLAAESGASLRGAGFRIVAELPARTAANSWQGPDRSRSWQPVFGQQKLRWELAA
jgi:hypothetical protein